MRLLKFNPLKRRKLKRLNIVESKLKRPSQSPVKKSLSVAARTRALFALTSARRTSNLWETPASTIVKSLRRTLTGLETPRSVIRSKLPSKSFLVGIPSNPVCREATARKRIRTLVPSALKYARFIWIVETTWQRWEPLSHMATRLGLTWRRRSTTMIDTIIILKIHCSRAIAPPWRSLPPKTLMQGHRSASTPLSNLVLSSKLREGRTTKCSRSREKMCKIYSRTVYQECPSIEFPIRWASL